MPSLLPGYEYDIFISYRQNDNRSGWVRQFVEDLREELGATLKDPVNIYFDENPHDGLQDTHLVDESLKGKLKCLIFIPILSRTYCDPKSFAWNHEFVPFCKLAQDDSLGLIVRLGNSNAACRVLPVQIHDIDHRDRQLYEQTTGVVMRAIEFVFRSPGVARPLTQGDSRSENQSKTIYRDQVNKLANAISEIIAAVATEPRKEMVVGPDLSPANPLSGERNIRWFWLELKRRNVIRAGAVYLIASLLVMQLMALLTPAFRLEERFILLASQILAMGFPLSLFLAWRYDVSPYGLVRTSSQKGAENPYTAAQRKPLTSGPMLFVLVSSLALLLVYGKLVFNPAAITPSDPVTIAVLPFENRSGDPGDKYFADGITEDIINRLTSTGKLIVRTKTAIQRFSGTTTVSELVDRLQVSYIVKGSVQRSGNQILVTAQLMDDKEYYLWGNTYTRTADNIIQLQSEISGKIVSQLRIKLSEIDLKLLHLQVTENATAYDCYLRGRSLYYRYERSANDSAIFEFKKAISLDPQYARAWAGLGDAMAQKHGRFGLLYSWTDSGLVASQRAIDLDSTLAEGYKAKALAYSYQKKYEQAIPLLLKAIELSPTYVQAAGNLGTNYFSLRDLPNALKWELASAGMDPSNWIPYQVIGWTYRLLGNLQQAELWLKKSLEQPNGRRYDTYEHLAYTYVSQGRKQEALRILDELTSAKELDTRVLETAGLIAHFAGDDKKAERYFMESISKNPNYKDDRNTFCPLGLGAIRWQQGNRIEAEVYLTQAMNNFQAELAGSSQSVDLPYYIASIHAIRGERNKSLDWLNRAIQSKWTDYAMLEFGPYFRAYRSDPEFTKIVQLLKASAASANQQIKP